MVAVILGREFSITVLRSVVHARGYSLPASPLGKLKMVSQVLAILILILGKGHLRDYLVLGHAALWIAMITAIISGVAYARQANAVLSGRPAPPRDPGGSPVAR